MFVWQCDKCEGKKTICLHPQKHRGSVRKKCRFHRGRLLHSVKAFLVSVKANLHPNLHLKFLFMSGLFLEVKGEGKKHKLAECAYTRAWENERRGEVNRSRPVCRERSGVFEKICRRKKHTTRRRAVAYWTFSPSFVFSRARIRALREFVFFAFTLHL